MARILLVEDDTQARLLMHHALVGAGHDVFAARDAREALDALQTAGSFDLVLAEMAMPGLSGIELALEMSVTYPDTPILLVATRGAAGPAG